MHFQGWTLLAGFLISVPNVISQDPAISLLTGRVNTLNQTSIATRTELTGLATRVTSLGARLNADFSFLESQIVAVTQNLSAVHVEVGTNTAAITDLSGKVDALAAELATANGKIMKLQSVNLIWQKNFRVVNKTFTELRKKVRFVVPRGRYIVGNIPLPYYFPPRRVG